MSTQSKNLFSSPDSTKKFNNVVMNVASVDGTTVAYATALPGWRWSTDVKPAAKTDLCQVKHTMLVLSGQMALTFNHDPKETIVKAGDLVVIPAQHDAWVVGNEPVNMVDISPGVKTWGTGDLQAEKTTVEQFITDFFAQIAVLDPAKWFLDNDVQMIRPSGNPLSVAEYVAGMSGKGDIKMESHALKAVKSVKLLGTDAAIVLVEHEEKFSFKENHEHDVALYSITLAKTAHGWRIAHLHRATGKRVAY